VPSIGFEWQFLSQDLKFQERDKGRWINVALPSKAVVWHWRDPGVKIESDAGDVEFITDPVRTWADLKNQLVLIGEILLALGMTVPDWSELSGDQNAELRYAMRTSGFGEGLGVDAAQAEGRGSRRRASAGVNYKVGAPPRTYPQRVEFTKNHLRTPQTGSDLGPIRLDRLEDGKLLLDFKLAEAVKESVSLDGNGDERPAAVFAAADSRIALVGMHQGAFNGAPQCTMEIPLGSLTHVIGQFSPQAVQDAKTWLGTGPVSEPLRGFVTMLFYYREMFGRSGIGTEKDGPKAVFNLLPRMNVRSVYRNLLGDVDRSAFDAKLAAMSDEARDAPLCPHGYQAVAGRFTNNLTWGEWLDSIRDGDRRAPVALSVDYAGNGPRGADYDRLSPPDGYPAHKHPARVSEWFTYSMGREQAAANSDVVLIEYRDAMSFLSQRGSSVNYLNFLKIAFVAAKEAGLDVPQG
jgi:hypothetical protein